MGEDPATAKVDAPSAFVWMAAGAVCFGLMNFFARVSSAHAHWAITACVRAAVGAVVAAIAAIAQGHPPLVKPTPLLWQRTVLGTTAMGLTFFALSDHRAPLADTVTLANTTPVFLAILAPFFLQERNGRRLAFALPIAVAGVVLVLHPTFLFPDAAHPPQPGAIVPESVAVVAALFSAFAMMTLRKLQKGENPESIVVHFSAVAAVVMGVIALFTAPGLPPKESVPPMLATGLAAGMGQMFMTRAYSLARAARVSAIGYLAIVVSAALGSLALHEPLSTHATLGMCLVIAAGLLIGVLGIRPKTR